MRLDETSTKVLKFIKDNRIIPKHLLIKNLFTTSPPFHPMPFQLVP